jgi:hypothetical protein
MINGRSYGLYAMMFKPYLLQAAVNSGSITRAKFEGFPVSIRSAEAGEAVGRTNGIVLCLIYRWTDPASLLAKNHYLSNFKCSEVAESQFLEFSFLMKLVKSF